MSNPRLETLREWMRKKNIFGFYVPIADPHNDEYIPKHWEYLRYLTGFTGSAATAIVTPTEARLWTDSRYWLQAEEELKDTEFFLMKEGDVATPSPLGWYKKSVEKISSDKPQIYAPYDMVTVAQCEESVRNWGVELVPNNPNDGLFESVWKSRSPLPQETIYVQDRQWLELSTSEKLQNVYPIIQEWAGKDVTYAVFNDAADIAWMLNLRGNDIACNPVFVAYFLCNVKQPTFHTAFTLFTHCSTLTQQAKSQLEECGVALQPYEHFTTALSSNERVAGDENQLPSFINIFKREKRFSPQPIAYLRARKDKSEQRGFREAMERDGVALVQFLRWFDEQKESKTLPTEIDVDTKLTAFRKKQEGFEQLSFPTIAAYAYHGAIVHYEATQETNIQLQPKSFLLLDSGAQFPCGTTDITRTLSLGTLSYEERLVYTLVLKGHLALQRLHFREGTTGLQLDVAARQYLWEEGYDFGHGTGHGVGCHLCVHEGPHQIRKDVRDCTLVKLEKGMTITDEPGVYIEGKFGVRIENTLLVVEDKTTSFGNFYKFEPLTLCPYDLTPLLRERLTNIEVTQINKYHSEVQERLLPRLNEEVDRQWLINACKPIA